MRRSGPRIRSARTRLGHPSRGSLERGSTEPRGPDRTRRFRAARAYRSRWDGPGSETRLRFAQEIEVLKTIWGPRIAAFLDADAEAEQPWPATEYIDGPDLRKHVHTHGPLSLALTASLSAALAEALAGVHKQGLLHRDLKPANILLGPNGPKIIDFGLAVFTESSASITAPNTVLGTPACMAPEQANGVKPLTAPVDVYALGAVLLYAASGHYPFQADNIHVLFHLITAPDEQRPPPVGYHVPFCKADREAEMRASHAHFPGPLGRRDRSRPLVPGRTRLTINASAP